MAGLVEHAESNAIAKTLKTLQTRVMRLLLIIFFLLFPGLTLASDAPDMSSLKRTGSGKVQTIIDGLTILLKDENIIRLSALDLPDIQGEADNPYALTAKETLEAALPEGTDVFIYQTRKAEIGRKNRMGHDLAHIVTKDGNLWINGLMVETGMARAMPSESNPDLAAALFDLEQKAIANNKGLWQGIPVLTPDTAEAAHGNIGVVQGRIESAASVRNNVYLNFGSNWRDDFTVMISPALRKKLSRAGIDVLSLSGQEVRVRGFIRNYNGAFMELAHESHLQVYPNP